MSCFSDSTDCDLLGILLSKVPVLLLQLLEHGKVIVTNQLSSCSRFLLGKLIMFWFAKKFPVFDRN